MTANQFYVQHIDPRSSRIIVEGDENHHLARVARIGPGENIRVFDRSGRSVLARVESVGPARTELTVLRQETREGTGLQLCLAQSFVPARKMEFILQKAAEFGVAEFLPLETTRSLKASLLRSERKLERWEKIVRESVKQSKGVSLTLIHPPVSMKAFLTARRDGRRIYLSENRGVALKSLLQPPDRSGSAVPASAILVVGPEGGWTEAEETSFIAHGFEPVSLGDRILRAETAALAAMAMMIHFWSR